MLRFLSKIFCCFQKTTTKISNYSEYSECSGSRAPFNSLRIVETNDEQITNAAQSLHSIDNAPHSLRHTGIEQIHNIHQEVLMILLHLLKIRKVFGKPLGSKGSTNI